MRRTWTALAVAVATAAALATVGGAQAEPRTKTPKAPTILHFGKGQTETDVPLTPGPHTLTLQFADGAHLSYGPTLSSTIKIQVAAQPAK